ncbi:TPM domain-containing protein [Leptospira ilyithenensis]|uniref:TPM domain-containing protein n=1 Tax=Leptospira ilyithenensis TaxID=2484901 RepID=UPI001AF01F86|nr:TPM domain-containing protein [Leptospira ilyithenensis]
MQNLRVAFFRFRILFFLLPIFLFSPNLLISKEVPKLSSHIIDETWTLTPGFEKEINDLLVQHEKETSNQVVVLLTSSLEDENLEEYSLRVAETWKLGQKGKDNGVLLFIAKDDRKLRIEVGYGLEGTLTDVLCHRIIEQEIKPSFKAGDFEEGIRNGVHKILDAIAGTYTIPPPKDYSYLGPFAFLGEMDGGGENIPITVRIFGSIFVFGILGIFTYLAANIPFFGWVLYFFLFPFWSLFPIALHGPDIGISIFLIYAIGIGLWKLYHLLTPHGRKRMKEKESSFGSSGGGSSSSSGGGWSSSSSGSSSFGGGGGSFGGGGSSGSW